MNKRITLAISGASGAPYALALIEQLLVQDIELYLLISEAAREVFRIESGIVIPDNKAAIEDYFINRVSQVKATLRYFSPQDWLAPVASGSNVPDAMVICPCSMGSLSAISHGASNNLLERSADVMLKEKKSLILVPREMPLSSIHLENMLKLSRMGVTILPASPGFYHHPENIQDIVNFVVARILSQLEIQQTLIKPWGKK